MWSGKWWGKKVQGKEEMRAELESMAEWVPDVLTIYSVITHGREGAANGELSFPEDEKVAFCDVYEFTNTKDSKLSPLSRLKTNKV
jgi:hypothetical protein